MPQDQVLNPTLMRLSAIEDRLDRLAHRIEVHDREFDGITRKMIETSSLSHDCPNCQGDEGTHRPEVCTLCGGKMRVTTDRYNQWAKVTQGFHTAMAGRVVEVPRKVEVTDRMVQDFCAAARIVPTDTCRSMVRRGLVGMLESMKP